MSRRIRPCGNPLRPAPRLRSRRRRVVRRRRRAKPDGRSRVLCMHMTDVRTVFFDLDDTLVDNTHAQRAAMRDTYEQFRAVFHQIPLDVLTHEYEKVNLRLWEQLS